ncbi:MAG: fused MFS/spermidine synthase [Chloroflexota bacterium]
MRWCASRCRSWRWRRPRCSWARLLPTLTRYSHGPRGLAGAFQRLYAANTIGAIAGTALAGFALIELLGLAGALRIGALCSAAAGVIALLLDRRWGAVTAPTAAAEPKASTVQPKPDSPPRTVPVGRRLALGLAFVSGLTSLGYQVTWNRLIGAGTGSSTYVFTIILALFLVGIATGAVILGLLRIKRTQAPTVIGIAQILTALLVVAGGLILASPADPFNGSAKNFLESLRTFAWSTALVVLPPTIAMGITFPATASLLGDDAGTEGSSSGALLAVNTAGSIVATFVLPFLVIPLIGSPATLASLAVINALVGAWLLAIALRARAAVRWTGALAGVVAAAIVAGSFATGSAFHNPTTTLIKEKGGEVFAATEDEIASVVAGTRGSKQLWVAGTSMTIITVDTKFMPLIPLMLRPAATRGLAVAFGMGTAFRTSLRAGVKTDVVELVPSVPSMFHWYYEDAPAVLANPNGRVIIADGRNHVELTPEHYDFVIVDPPPPIESSGVSVISSLEFYQAAKARLTQDGVMIQWVPYGQTQEEFLAHVRTFASVFPNVNVIAGPGGYGFYMIGSDGPVTLTPDGIIAVLERPGVLEDVNGAPDAGKRTPQQWSDRLLGLEWAQGDQLRAAIPAGPLITDDRPMPEYFLLRRLANPNLPQLSLGGLRALLH